MVYDSLCRFSPEGSMVVLAPRRHYLTGEMIPGTEEFDSQAPFPIHRVDLLRPTVRKSHNILHSVWLQLTIDVPLKIRLAWTVTRLVRRDKIDVLCIGELNSGSWIGLFAQRWLGCRMINYIHGEEITTQTNYRFYGRNRERYLAHADAVVAVSGFTKQALQDLMGVDPAKIALIQNGVDAERFTPGPPPQYLMERYGLAGKRVLMTVGRLVERKGIDRTIEAMPEIVAAVPDAHYLIVGEGEYRTHLERLVADQGMSEHVTFAGRVPEEELVDHYRFCDLFLMPNRELSDHDTEGFGLVFLEANACGKAVVGGRAGGAVEAVQEGRNGLLVNGDKPPEIAVAVIRLLTDTALREQIETTGLEIARAASSKEKARQFHQLCQRLVGETP